MEDMQDINAINKEETLENEGKVTKYNLVPRFIARILSFLVDMFLVFIAGFGIFQLELSTPISSEYTRMRYEIISIQDVTKEETNYGYRLYEDEESYSSYYSKQVYLNEDEASEKVGKHYIVVDYDNLTTEVKNAYSEALTNNGVYQSHMVTYRAIYFGLIVLASGVSELVLIFLVPLFNKRRATIGRFIAMTSLISKREVQAKWWQLLIRFLFVLLIETALPLFYFSEIATILIVIGVNLVVIIISRKTRRTLRDYVSLTRIIDKKTFKPINEQ